MSNFPFTNQTFGKYISTVATVDDLRDFPVSGIKAGDSIIVGSSITVGDGLGGVYIWFPKETRADDGLRTVKPSRVTNGRWLIAVGPVTSIRPIDLVIVDGLTDNTADLQRLVTAGNFKITRREKPYMVSGLIYLPKGRIIEIEPGTEIVYTGPKETISGPKGVFRLSDDCSIVSSGGEGTEFIVRAKEYNPMVSAVSGLGVANIRIVGCRAINMTQVYFECTEAGTPYDNVVTKLMKSKGDTRPINTNRDMAIIGGGADYPGHFPDGGLGNLERSGAFMIFCEDYEIRDTTYSGCYSAIQYWGGDSGLLPFQDLGRIGPSMERKNGNARFTNVVGKHLGAGIWGSCGHDIIITNCAVYYCGDVGHDHEGSFNITMVGCWAEDCRNGGYASFSLSKGFSMIGCSGRVSDRLAPHFRMYNFGQTQENIDFTIQGGRFECTDPAGPNTAFDCNNGSARQITISGVELVNGFINLSANNNGRIVVKENRLSYTTVSTVPFDAITIGGLAVNGGYGSSKGVIQGNWIYSEGAQPVGTRSMYMVSSDFNSTPDVLVKDNNTWVPIQGGSFAPIRADSRGANGGASFVVIFDGNLTDGQIQTNSTGAATPGTFYARNNYTSRNAEVTITGV